MDNTQLVQTAAGLPIVVYFFMGPFFCKRKAHFYFKINIDNFFYFKNGCLLWANEWKKLIVMDDNEIII